MTSFFEEDLLFLPSGNCAQCGVELVGRAEKIDHYCDVCFTEMLQGYLGDECSLEF